MNLATIHRADAPPLQAVLSDQQVLRLLENRQVTVITVQREGKQR